MVSLKSLKLHLLYTIELRFIRKIIVIDRFFTTLEIMLQFSIWNYKCGLLCVPSFFEKVIFNYWYLHAMVSDLRVFFKSEYFYDPNLKFKLHFYCIGIICFPYKASRFLIICLNIKILDLDVLVSIINGLLLLERRKHFFREIQKSI